MVFWPRPQIPTYYLDSIFRTNIQLSDILDKLIYNGGGIYAECGFEDIRKNCAAIPQMTTGENERKATYVA